MSSDGSLGVIGGILSCVTSVLYLVMAGGMGLLSGDPVAAIGGAVGVLLLLAGIAAITRSRAGLIGSAVLQLGLALVLIAYVVVVFSRPASNPYSGVVVVLVLPALMHTVAGSFCVAAARR